VRVTLEGRAACVPRDVLLCLLDQLALEDVACSSMSERVKCQRPHTASSALFSRGYWMCRGLRPFKSTGQLYDSTTSTRRSCLSRSESTYGELPNNA
jgi:hypothetical protein